ncbi:hypothetical protein V6R86_05985 [Sphingomonas kaistensis]|uniref:Uncharacterized protein n=1 Tax=Sphingomonas kaistensis TaxID=298708 RepID=A0ABZ2FZI0_9SPHN
MQHFSACHSPLCNVDVVGLPAFDQEIGNLVHLDRADPDDADVASPGGGKAGLAVARDRIELTKQDGALASVAADAPVAKRIGTTRCADAVADRVAASADAATSRNLRMTRSFERRRAGIDSDGVPYGCRSPVSRHLASRTALR